TENAFCDVSAEGFLPPAVAMTSCMVMSRRVPLSWTPMVGGHEGTRGKQSNPTGPDTNWGLEITNHGGTSDGSLSPIRYWSSGLYWYVPAIVRKRPLPRS